MTQIAIEIPPLPAHLEPFRVIQAAMNSRDEEEATIKDLIKDIEYRLETVIGLNMAISAEATRFIPAKAEQVPVVDLPRFQSSPAAEKIVDAELVTTPVPVLDKETGATLMGQPIASLATTAPEPPPSPQQPVTEPAEKVCRSCGKRGRTLCYSCAAKTQWVKRDDTREDLEDFDVDLLCETLAKNKMGKEAFANEFGVTTNFSSRWKSGIAHPSRDVVAAIRKRFPEAFKSKQSNPVPQPEVVSIDAPVIDALVIEKPHHAPTPAPAPTPSPLPPLPEPKTFSELFSSTPMHGWGKDEQAIKAALVMGVEIFKGSAFKVVKCPELGFIPEAINYLPPPPIVSVCKATKGMRGWSITIMPGGLK